MTALSLAVGSALLLLLAADVFITTFHPEAHGGVVQRALTRSVWRLVRGAGTWRGRQRPGILALGGPLTAVATLVSWVSLLILGFALLYLPFMAEFHYSGGSSGSPWIEALYYSGYVASTVGLGDTFAVHGALRLATVAEGVLGFSLFSLAITYLLSLNREQSARAALATEIAYHLKPDSSGEWDLDERHLALAERWAERLNPQLAAIQAAHRHYPVLHYYWSHDPDDALPLQLGRLLDWLDRIGEQPAAPELFRPPSALLALRRSVHDYLRDVTEQFLPAGAAVQDEDAGGGEDSWKKRHHAMLRYLGYE